MKRLTLIEVVFATGILSVGLLLLGFSASTSSVISQASQPRVVATQAGHLLIERLRAEPYQTVFGAYWSNPDLTVETIDGRTWVTGGDLNAIFAEVASDVLDPAFDRGLMKSPGGASLALRFVSEADYNAACGTSLDLNGDGDALGTLPAPRSGAPDPQYAFYPVQVLIRWRDRNGVQRHRIMGALTLSAPQDPGS